MIVNDLTELNKDQRFGTVEDIKKDIPTFKPPTQKQIESLKEGDMLKVSLMNERYLNREIFFSEIEYVIKEEGKVKSFMIRPDTVLFDFPYNHDNMFEIKSENIIRCGENYDEPLTEEGKKRLEQFEIEFEKLMNKNN